MSETKKRWPETLGSTVEEIANTLYNQGVRGIPKCIKNCIIARSYKHTYPDGWSGLKATYCTRGVEVLYGRLTFNDCQIIDPNCPKVLAEFMYRFDKGEFPQLIIGSIPSKKDVLSKLTTEELIAIGK